MISKILLPSEQIRNKSGTNDSFPLKAFDLAINHHKLFLVLSRSQSEPWDQYSWSRSSHWDSKIQSLGLGLVTETARFAVSVPVSMLRLGFLGLETGILVLIITVNQTHNLHNHHVPLDYDPNNFHDFLDTTFVWLYNIQGVW